MKELLLELKRMQIFYETIDLLQNKNGVLVARITNQHKSYIFKYFERKEFRREIDNYRLLASMNIPTIHVYDMSERAILMEDINASNTYRLGCEQDLHDPVITSLLAEWYRLLHTQGYAYMKHKKQHLYDENDVLTLDTLQEIKQKTNTMQLPIWNVLEDHFHELKQKLQALPRTLTYNDFYYTNLIVANDQSSAFMYDYNLLGKGYAYADLRNVCSSLSHDAGQCFLKTYGSYALEEQLVDDVVSVLISLHTACQKECLPKWAEELIKQLSTTYPKKVMHLFKG